MVVYYLQVGNRSQCFKVLELLGERADNDNFLDFDQLAMFKFARIRTKRLQTGRKDKDEMRKAGRGIKGRKMKMKGLRRNFQEQTSRKDIFLKKQLT